MLRDVQFIPPKRGKAYQDEVWTDEYKSFREMWGNLTDDERRQLIVDAGIEWVDYENESVNGMRMSMAYQEHLGIEKHKPEYQSKEARDRVMNGYAPMFANNVVVTNPKAISTPKDDDDEETGELELKLRWPEQPPQIQLMANFDKPSWYEGMKLMVSIGRHISIEGPPSIGKDTAVEQLAAEMGMPLVAIGGDGGFRTRDLVGDQQLVGGTSFYNVGEYVTAAINGWWVLLTEVNAADPSALMYINRQLAAPYVVNLGGKAYPVHPNFRLFVTYNHGLVGTKPLPQSFKDRFFSIKESFFTEAQLRKRLSMMGWSNKPEFDMANAIIVQFGVKMWDAYERGQMRYQITTRRLKDAIDLLVVGNFPVKEALKMAVIGAIDSPVEAKAAEKVLDSVLSGGY